MEKYIDLITGREVTGATHHLDLKDGQKLSDFSYEK